MQELIASKFSNNHMLLVNDKHSSHLNWKLPTLCQFYLTGTVFMNMKLTLKHFTCTLINVKRNMKLSEENSCYIMH